MYLNNKNMNGVHFRLKLQDHNHELHEYFQTYFKNDETPTMKWKNYIACNSNPFILKNDLSVFKKTVNGYISLDWTINKKFTEINLDWLAYSLTGFHDEEFRSHFPDYVADIWEHVVIVRHVFAGLFRCIIRLACILRRVRIRIRIRRLFLMSTLYSNGPLRQFGPKMFSREKQMIWKCI